MNTIFSAYSDGLARVRRAPAILFGIYALALVFTALPGLALRDTLESAIGSGRDAAVMANGVSLEWWDQFGETATGLGRTFSPTIIGFGAVLDNVSRILDGHALPAAAAVLVAASMVGWLFLAGGILDRLARNRPLRAAAFFGACGTYFPRFLRLGLLGLAGYAVVIGVLHPWLFGTVWDALTRDMTVERNAFLVNLALYAVFGLALITWNVVLDYAKIRAVIEDRRSMIGALVAAWRFVVTHPADAAGLYVVNALGFLVVVGLYALVAPGAGRPGWTMWLGFAVGQVYVLLRLAVKLVFWASQVALFDRSLAHHAHTAPPVPVWPESAAAEAITNAATISAVSGAVEKRPG